MINLETKIADVKFKNPVITASGTFGYGQDYLSLYSIEKLGGVSVKGTTLNARLGNLPPRIAETPSGCLNSVGLQNPGVEVFINEYLPWLKKQNTVVIANVAGATIKEYGQIAAKLDCTDVDMIEVNISCPNVKEGGVAFGTNAKTAAKVTAEVRKSTKKPIIMKLSPNVTDITEIAGAVEGEGADCVSLINTLLGMRIDTATRKPILRNNVGGLSGAAVFPVALRMVWQAANAVAIPIIGMGGITCGEDAVEMMLAGASAVQVGTAIMTDPFAPLKIVEGIEKYLSDNKIENVADLVGKVEIH